MLFAPEKNNLFQGILYNNKEKYLIQQSSDNVNINRTNNIVDDNSASYSCTKNESFSYFNFTFYGKNTVRVTSYSIRSYDINKTTASYPRSWVLSGYDGKSWINISTVVESNLNSFNKTGTYRTYSSHAFSALKLTQIREAYNYVHNYFCFSEFELFGSFGFHPRLCFTQQRYRSTCFSLLSLTMMIIT